jgi:hypothetical protein
MSARKTSRSNVSEVTKLRAELAEMRSALALANQRAELAHADLSIERLLATHDIQLVALAFYENAEHYPDAITKDVGGRARTAIDKVLASPLPKRATLSARQ